MYAIDAMRYHATFKDEDTARKCFEEVKELFSYCELKEIIEVRGHYYAQSLAIHHR